MKQKKSFIVLICIFVCIFMVGCGKGSHSSEKVSHDSIEKIGDKLESLCLDSHDTSMTFSMNRASDSFTNDYHYKYLSMLHVKKDSFEVLQRTVLAGQSKDAQRASVSIRLFLDRRLYGEYTGLNNFYSIKISSNRLLVYNHEIRNQAVYEMKDSIPGLLFFPYGSNTNTGDIFYFNKNAL